MKKHSSHRGKKAKKRNLQKLIFTISIVLTLTFRFEICIAPFELQYEVHMVHTVE